MFIEGENVCAADDKTQILLAIQKLRSISGKEITIMGTKTALRKLPLPDDASAAMSADEQISPTCWYGCKCSLLYFSQETNTKDFDNILYLIPNGECEDVCVKEALILKSCPFCGGKANIIICDDEGNHKTDDYEYDP